MKKLVVILGIACAAQLAAAGSIASTHPLAKGTVALTNTQVNSVWIPVAVLVSFPTPNTGSFQVWRSSQAHSYLLDSCTFTNVSTVIWEPNVNFPFTLGEALVIRSSITNGFVQVIRKGE